MPPLHPIREKRKKHKHYLVWSKKKYSTDHLFNRPLDAEELKIQAGVPPFTFIVSIEDDAGVHPLSIDINGVSKQESAFEHAGTKTTCTIETLVSLTTFVLIIKAKGTPGAKTTFNLTCDDQKVYPQDQDLEIGNTGKGLFEDLKAPMPS